jgi:hypothetical protein
MTMTRTFTFVLVGTATLAAQTPCSTATDVHASQATEAVILTPDGGSPYKPLTREGFFLSRERQLENIIVREFKERLDVTALKALLGK